MRLILWMIHRNCMLITWLGMPIVNVKELAWAEVSVRAAWHGARVILRQVSDEATRIFDFILEMFRACDGEWAGLSSSASVSPESVREFLEYAATFLGNIGNYYVSPEVWRNEAEDSSITGARRSEIHPTHFRGGLETPFNGVHKGYHTL